MGRKHPMNRDLNLQKIEEVPDEWDVLIIGGGATGLGAAVDSASRGFKTLLLEQSDFAKGTSSRSTKLIHGGLRYLQQGNLSLVVEALRERGLLCQNAPHLVHPLSFLIPSYKWWEGPFYGMGIKVYDFLAGSLGLKGSSTLSLEQTKKRLPTLDQEGLKGGVIYYDGQFDDARLAITLARTANNLGGVLLNYMQVTSFIKKQGHCIGVKAVDMLSQKEYTLKSKVIINATGIFVDGVRHLDDPKAPNIIAPSQGTHLILPKEFLPCDTALLIPSTEDKRVLFFVPWHDKVLLGTTDIEISKVQLEPKAQKKEIAFLLKYAANYLTKAPTSSDILSVFTGIRPLVRANEHSCTSELSRDHRILVSKSGLITIAGGKWTTYRQMAEDVIDKAIQISSLPDHPCITRTLSLHGYCKNVDPKDPWSVYGSDRKILESFLKKEGKELKKPIHPNLAYTQVEVLFAARKEMACTVEDILARRSRSLLLDAKASIEAAPLVTKILAKELNKSREWQEEQIKSYHKLARGYLPS